MATGIQTGIRRGSRPQTNAAQPVSVWGQLRSRWVELTRKTKTVIVVALALSQSVVFGWGLYSFHTRSVELYSHKLSEFEVKEVSQALFKSQIEHELSTSNDGVLVGKQDLLQARSLLKQLGLPRTQAVTPELTKPSSLLSTDERKALQQRVLEGEIVATLRQVEGVQNAWVKLAVPARKMFGDEEEKPRASVTLALQPGVSLDGQTVSNLANQVAFSVPGLMAENVHFSDTEGNSLKSRFNPQQDGSDAFFLLRLAEERHLRDKLQQVLDVKLPGKTKVVVNLDMDFSEAEEKIYTPGNEIDKGMVLSSRQEIAEILKSGKDDKDFENKKRSENYKVAEHYLHVLRKYARVERLSATVFADGISAKEAEELKIAAAGALGAKESRGDFVHVDNAPWDHQMLPHVSQTEFPALPVVDNTEKTLLTYQGLLALLAAQSLLMIGGAAAFLYLTGRQRQDAVALGSPLSDLKATGIVDHGRSKLGVTHFDVTTSIHASESLEGFVRQRPTQAADLLRSTWLS